MRGCEPVFFVCFRFLVVVVARTRDFHIFYHDRTSTYGLRRVFSINEPSILCLKFLPENAFLRPGMLSDGFLVAIVYVNKLLVCYLLFCVIRDISFFMFQSFNG